MPTIKTNEIDVQMMPFRPSGLNRVYSNHVEINLSQIDLNIKFCDARPPENEEESKKIKAEGKVLVPVVSEVVIPLVVAVELKRILNERLKEATSNE